MNNVWADPIPEPKDPCNGNCGISSSTGICAGCFRTLKEVREWTGYSKEEQNEILAETVRRKKSIETGKPFYAQHDPDRRQKK